MREVMIGKTVKDHFVGALFMLCVVSLAVNAAFYTGKLTSPQGAYCDGFLSGAQNAVGGQINEVRKGK
jgi:hypothetical protein